MKIEHFKNTDTALINFTDRSITETKESSEYIYIDIDREENLVSMTIELGKEYGALPEIHYKAR